MADTRTEMENSRLVGSELEPKEFMKQNLNTKGTTCGPSFNTTSSNDLRRINRFNAKRRSLSGAALSCFFDTKFQHFKTLQKTQNESRGMNFLLAPMSAAIYRSSLPVTPIATPTFGHSLKFTEQTLQDRMKFRSQANRNRNLYKPFTYNQPDTGIKADSQMDCTQQALVNDKLSGIELAITEELVIGEGQVQESTSSSSPLKDISSNSSYRQRLRRKNP